jgi:hypothetical protein
LLLEPGRHEPNTWPGKNSMGTSFVARAVLYTDEHGPLMSFTAVATYSPESDTARHWSQASIKTHDGQEVTGAIRGVFLGMENIDGAQVPVLTEMPIGHMRN